MRSNPFDGIRETDRSLTARLQLGDEDKIERRLFGLAAHSGDTWLILLGLGLVWLIGDAAWHALAIQMVIAILILAIFVGLIKFTVRRKRPEGDWGQIYRKTDPNSFPSGHAARATLLVVFAFGSGSVWLGLLVLVWAIVVSLSRIVMGLHFVSDVVVGAFIGFFAGLLALVVLS
jgi:undecaprenyl-diphosphatase